jgi:hypothetical protein
MGRRVKAHEIPLDQTYCVHKLLEHGDTLMSDCPQEIESQLWQIERFKGKVLIGGLGLGWAVMQLEKNPDVTEITVVELSQDVIDLVWKYLPVKKSKIVCADLYKYLRSAKKQSRKWDFAFYDIWSPTGQRILTESVIPLRKLSYGRIKQENIECWQEITMLGQVAHNLYTQIQLRAHPFPNEFKSLWQMSDEEFKMYKKACPQQYAFINWMRHTKPSDDDALFMLRHYIKTYSDPKQWQEYWGSWDK